MHNIDCSYNKVSLLELGATRSDFGVEIASCRSQFFEAAIDLGEAQDIPNGGYIRKQNFAV